MADPDNTLMMTILRELQEGVAELRRGQFKAEQDRANLRRELDERFELLTARIAQVANRLDEGLAGVSIALRRLSTEVRAGQKSEEEFRLELADLKARIVALEMRLRPSS